jgi:hypothetical protein
VEYLNKYVAVGVSLKKRANMYIDSGIIKWNTKHIQDFQNRAKVKCKEEKSIPLTHKYKTAHFPGPKIS